MTAEERRQAGTHDRSGRNLRSLAYDALREEIVLGRLQPGDSVSEADRAAALGISRTPVREAIQRLAAEGLVETFPKRGTLVARLSPRDVRESFELREAVEGMCAKLAAERRSDGDLADLRNALSGTPSYQQGATFHAGVVRAARNRYLQEVFDTTSGRIDLASRMAAQAALSSHTPNSTHEAVLAAIEARDAPQAEARMRRHLQEHAACLIGRLL